YRLKQVDTDGAISYSEIRNVSLGFGNDILLFPNPANDFFTLVGKDLSLEHIHLIDAFGKTVKLDVASVSEEAITFSTTSLSAGVYFVRYQNDFEEKTIKLNVYHQ
nr:T9SS type A sorting domain-containing protein [Fluviicola sp.]